MSVLLDKIEIIIFENIWKFQTHRKITKGDHIKQFKSVLKTMYNRLTTTTNTSYNAY